MIQVTEEQFTALGQHFLNSMQTHLNDFRESYESDSDFANDEERSDILREVGRCMQELIDLNDATVE